MVGVAVCLCALVSPLFAVFLLGLGEFRFNLVLGSTPKVARLMFFFFFTFCIPVIPYGTLVSTKIHRPEIF